MIEEIKAIASIVKSKTSNNYLKLLPILFIFTILVGVFAVIPSTPQATTTTCAGLSALVTGLSITPPGGSAITPFGPTTITLVCTFCQIYNTAFILVLFVSLALLALGGVLYASAHILPGQNRGALLGYAFGMIIGGVVGIILVFLAPFIINFMITNFVGGILGLLIKALPTGYANLTDVCTLVGFL